MAAFARIGRRNLTNLSPSFLLPPALLICCRGIASKLFVGGALSLLLYSWSVCFPSASPQSDSRLGNDKQGSIGALLGCAFATSVHMFLCLTFMYAFYYVPGLSFYTTEKGLSEHFSQYGQVVEAKIVMDRVSDRSKGFGIVTFASEEEAQKARTEMDGKASPSYLSPHIQLFLE
ncbi:Small RNA-binding protein 11, chloroplastic [Vitis vinifera]|uniref:Small RNA-binding protein 11, chloroplastic n=1 Tax=Vitis vinifera TaxID=29760 RepID=A0A438JS52_VITVI|nr:Small RNA-binding protein 11, chloroplastic [Vitis vinifera]